MAEYPKAPELDFDPESDAEPVNADGLTEAETIDLAETEISAAQYRALHDRLEDFVVWLGEMGMLAPRPIHGDLFEMIEEYLDEAKEHESRSPLVQILQPDMSEFVESGHEDFGPEPGDHGFVLNGG